MCSICKNTGFMVFVTFVFPWIMSVGHAETDFASWCQFQAWILNSGKSIPTSNLEKKIRRCFPHCVTCVFLCFQNFHTAGKKWRIRTTERTTSSKFTFIRTTFMHNFHIERQKEPRIDWEKESNLERRNQVWIEIHQPIASDNDKPRKSILFRTFQPREQKNSVREPSRSSQEKSRRSRCVHCLPIVVLVRKIVRLTTGKKCPSFVWLSWLCFADESSSHRGDDSRSDIEINGRKSPPGQQQQFCVLCCSNWHKTQKRFNKQPVKIEIEMEEILGWYPLTGACSFKSGRWYDASGTNLSVAAFNFWSNNCNKNSLGQAKKRVFAKKEARKRQKVSLGHWVSPFTLCVVCFQRTARTSASSRETRSSSKASSTRRCWRRVRAASASRSSAETTRTRSSCRSRTSCRRAPPTATACSKQVSINLPNPQRQAGPEIR